jgi:hypothetical protein
MARVWRPTLIFQLLALSFLDVCVFVAAFLSHYGSGPPDVNDIASFRPAEWIMFGAPLVLLVSLALAWWPWIFSARERLWIAAFPLLYSLLMFLSPR